MSKLRYRILLCLVLPTLPLLMLVGHLLAGAPEYWEDLCDCYRAAPKAFKKGEPL